MITRATVKFLLTLIAPSLLWLCTEARAEIELFYSERPPFASRTANGEVEGLTASPAAAAFHNASIPFKWREMPFKLQLIELELNRKPACAIGMFQTLEREAYARFTRPIYRDRSFVIISRATNKALLRHRDLTSLLQDPELQLLVMDGFSYGDFMDREIERLRPRLKIAYGSTNQQRLDLLAAGKADYFFVSPEELETLLARPGNDRSLFQVRELEGIPPGNLRRIACSLQVDRGVIDALNQGLSEDLP